MKNAANVVPGVFAATGHDYRADLLPFFNAVLGLDATPDQLASIGAWLEARESLQSQWMKAHGAVEQGPRGDGAPTADAGGARRRSRSRRAADPAVPDGGGRRVRRDRRASRSSAPRRLVTSGTRPRPFVDRAGGRRFGRALQRRLPSARRAPGPARHQRRARPARWSGSHARRGSGPPTSGSEPAAFRRADPHRGSRRRCRSSPAWAPRLRSRRPGALLADEKITGTGRAEAAFETFVRIPLETALAEEIIFRGVLLGLGLRSRYAVGAVVSSSIWFGLWHVYPTLGSLGRGGGGGVVGDRPHHVGGATAGSGREPRPAPACCSRGFGYGRAASPPR